MAVRIYRVLKSTMRGQSREEGYCTEEKAKVVPVEGPEQRRRIHTEEKAKVVPVEGPEQRRRIHTEEKAKVVPVAWGTRNSFISLPH